MKNDVRRVRIHSDRGLWLVSLDDATEAQFNGAAARARALEAGLSLAEELRAEGTVLVLVENPDRDPTPVARRRLAA